MLTKLKKDDFLLDLCYISKIFLCRSRYDTRVPNLVHLCEMCCRSILLKLYRGRYWAILPHKFLTHISASNFCWLICVPVFVSFSSTLRGSKMLKGVRGRYGADVPRPSPNEPSNKIFTSLNMGAKVSWVFEHPKSLKQVFEKLEICDERNNPKFRANQSNFFRKKGCVYGCLQAQLLQNVTFPPRSEVCASFHEFSSIKALPNAKFQFLEK